MAVLVLVLILSLISLYRARHSRIKVAAVLALALPLAACFAITSADAVVAFGRSAFAYDDLTGRGISSGFSGRLLVWEKALVVIADHPLLGVGPRLGPNYLDGWSTHNGYLQVLVEFGACGAAALLALLVGLTGSVIRRAGRGEPLARIASALALAYYAVAIFESRILNAGNPTSMIFWMLLLYPPQRAGMRPPSQVAVSARPMPEWLQYDATAACRSLPRTPSIREVDTGVH